MTATTLTLTDFLLARIAEDEAVARKMDERHDWSQSWECRTGGIARTRRSVPSPCPTPTTRASARNGGPRRTKAPTQP